MSVDNRLGAMIRHISRRNSFDKRELIQLLKDAREEINPRPRKNEYSEGFMRKEQAE